jgi:hypothetical protein
MEAAFFLSTSIRISERQLTNDAEKTTRQVSSNPLSTSASKLPRTPTSRSVVVMNFVPFARNKTLERIEGWCVC